MKSYNILYDRSIYTARTGVRRKLRQMPYSYVHGPVTNRQGRGGMPL